MFFGIQTIFGLLIVEKSLAHLYQSPQSIKEVFFGFKDRYLIVQDGQKIIAKDIKNKEAIFEIYQLNNADAEVYYDNSTQKVQRLKCIRT
ncbi:MAG: hypothetical protein NC925_01110 [Candidatus Omnitrophica bacterium]|nr:hypothetical protein [Candidatus Omnitrophota bacterium]MCM8831388.1 hypothetical protein [Candidatus Omnitrophota bacterium]